MYHKWQSYDVWFLRYWTWQTDFFVILDHFLPFYPFNNLKNQNSEKRKKPPRDIIILHKCTKNDNCMMYGSRNVKCYRQNFLWFLTVFCPFTLVIILHMCTINNNHMMHGSWDMTHDRCKCYFSFWAIFCPFTPLTAQKIEILKKWRKKTIWR